MAGMPVQRACRRFDTGKEFFYAYFESPPWIKRGNRPSAGARRKPGSCQGGLIFLDDVVKLDTVHAHLFLPATLADSGLHRSER